MKIMCVLVAQLCRKLCDPVDYSPPGSSVHGILQAGVLEWAATAFSVVLITLDCNFLCMFLSPD